MKRNLRFLSASPHGNLISTSGWNATLCERRSFFFESKIASMDENRKMGHLDASRREPMDMISFAGYFVSRVAMLQLKIFHDSFTISFFIISLLVVALLLPDVSESRACPRVYIYIYIYRLYRIITTYKYRVFTDCAKTNRPRKGLTSCRCEDKEQFYTFANNVVVFWKTVWMNSARRVTRYRVKITYDKIRNEIYGST